MKKYENKTIKDNIKDKLKDSKISSSIIKSILSVALLVIIGLGLRYVFFELRPFVISYIEEVTGYRIDFKEIKTDIANNFEIEDFRMYSRLDGSIIEVDTVDLTTKIGNVFGGTIESLVSSLSEIELNGMNLRVNERFFESKLFNIDKDELPTNKGLDINKIKLILKVNEGEIEYYTTSDTEYARIKDLNLELKLDHGEETMVLDGVFDYSTSDILNFSNPQKAGLIKQETPIKITLFNNDNSTHYKGNILMESFTYNEAMFEDILVGVDITEEKLSLFSIEEHLYLSDILDYVPFYLKKKADYNISIPELHLDYFYDNMNLNLSVYMKESPDGIQPLDLFFTKLAKTNYIKDLVDTIQTLAGRPIDPILEHPFGVINLSLDLTLPDDNPDYGEVFLELGSNKMLHQGDEFDIVLAGNFAEYRINDVYYHSDKVGTLKGQMDLYSTAGLGKSEIIVEDFNFMGMLNLNTMITNDKLTNSWERFKFTSTTSKWSIPGLEDYEFHIPPAHLDLYNTMDEMDLNISVIQQDVFPLKVSIHMNYEGEDQDEIPIRATVKDFDLVKLEERIPSLVKDGSNMNNMNLNLVIDGFIHGVDFTKSNINIDSYIVRDNGYIGSYYAGLQSSYKGNVLNVGRFILPSMGVKFNGKIDLDKYTADLTASVYNDRYRLTGGLIKKDKQSYNTILKIILPDKTILSQSGNISLTNNSLTMSSVFNEYSPKGLLENRGNLTAEVVKGDLDDDIIDSIYKATAELSYNSLNIYLSGATEFMKSGFINSQYNLNSKDFSSDIVLNINPDGITKSNLKATSQFYMEDTVLILYNEFRDNILFTDSELKTDGVTSLIINGEHGLQGLGLDGWFTLKDIDGNRIAKYNGLVYLAGLDFSNIYIEGLVNTLNNDVIIDGKLNLREGKIGYKGLIESDFGVVDMIAGVVPTDVGFNINAIGDFNGNSFTIKSNNVISQGSISTKNKFTYDDIHTLNIQTDIQNQRNHFNIMDLNYDYYNSEEPVNNDSGSLNFYLTYTDKQYDMVLDAYFLRNTIDAEGYLKIQEGFYATDLSLSINSEKFQLKGSIEKDKQTYNAILSFITPDATISGVSTVSILNEQVRLSNLSIIGDNQPIVSVEGIIKYPQKKIEPDLNIILDKQNYHLIGDIGFTSVKDIPIDLRLTMPDYSSYNIKGHMGYNESLITDMEITSDDGQYYKIVLQTSDFNTIKTNIKSGRAENSFGLSANVTFLDEGFIYTDIRIDNSNISFDGRIRPFNNNIEFRDFDIYDGEQPLYNLYGNVYYGFDGYLEEYLSNLINPPGKGYNLLAMDFNGSDTEGNLVKLTSWVNNEDNVYYASIKGVFNDKMVLRSDDIYLNMTNSLEGYTTIQSNFNIDLDLYGENNLYNTINLGKYNISGRVGGESTLNNNLPIYINLSIKDIGLDEAIHIGKDITINTRKSSVKATITTSENGYEISSYSEGFHVYGNIGLNNSTRFSIQDIDFEANMNDAGFKVKSLEFYPDIEYRTYEDGSSTIIDADGKITFIEDRLNIDITGNYNGEDLILTGDIKGSPVSYPTIASDNLRFLIGENILWYQGSLGLDGEIIRIDSNINLNESRIKLKGGISSTDSGLMTSGIMINIDGVEMFVEGEAGLIDDYIYTNLILNTPIADNLSVNGNIKIDDMLVFDDLNIGNKDMNWLVNGNILLGENKITSNLTLSDGRTEYKVKGPIHFNDDEYSANLRLIFRDMKAGKTNVYYTKGELNIPNNDEYEVSLSLKDSSELLLSLTGDIGFDGKQGKYSTDNLKLTLPGDINLGIAGYVISNNEYSLDTSLDIEYAGVTSKISLLSEDLEEFNLDLVYDKDASGINIQSLVEIVNQNEFYSETEIILSESDKINIIGDILLREDGLSLNDMVVYQNKQERLGKINSLITLNNNGINTYNQIELPDDSLLEAQANISTNEKGNISGRAYFNYDNQFEYNIDDYIISFDSDNRNTYINVGMDSHLNINSPSKSLKKSRMNIKDTNIYITIPNTTSNGSGINSLNIEAVFSGITLDEDLILEEGLYLKKIETDLMVDIRYLTNELFINVNIPELYNEIDIGNGDGKTISNISIQDFDLNTKIDAQSNFRVLNMSTFLSGEVNTIDDGGNEVQSYQIKQNEITYNGKRFNLDIEIQSEKEFYNINGKVDYVFGDKLISSKGLKISSNDLLVTLSGETSILDNGIRLDNAFVIDDITGNLNGDILFKQTDRGNSLIELSGLNLGIDGNKIKINGGLVMDDKGMNNNINLSYQDMSLSLAGLITMENGLFIEQRINTDLIEEEVLFYGRPSVNKEFILPNLTFEIDETHFELTGGLSFLEGRIKLNEFGINSIDYAYTGDGFIYTTSGYIDINNPDNIKADFVINDGVSKYELLSNINHEPDIREFHIDLNLIMPDDNEIDLYTLVDYSDNIKLNIKTTYDILDIDAYAEIANEKANITVIIGQESNKSNNGNYITKSTNPSYQNQSSTVEEIASAYLEVDFENDFDSKLAVVSDSFNYYANISLDPQSADDYNMNDILPALPEPISISDSYKREEYIIYTNGFFELLDGDSSTKYRIKTAHNIGSNGYLLDNNIRVNLTPDSALETDVQFKMTQLWLVLNGNMKVYTEDEALSYTDEIFNFDYNTEIAFSEKGIYGNIDVGAFGLDLSYGGIINLDQPDNINLDGSIKMFGLLYLINGDIFIDYDNGLIMPDFDLYKDNNDITVNGVYNYESQSQEVKLKGFYNDNPYDMNFSLINDEVENNHIPQTSDNSSTRVMRLNPFLELKVWGDTIFKMKSSLTITDEEINYQALFNDTIDLFFRYNTPRDFLLNISHEPIEINDGTGNSFKFHTNDFNISGVDGDIRTRLSFALNDFISSGDENINLNINLASSHELIDTGLDDIVNIISYGTDEEVSGLLEGFEFQNIEIKWKEIFLYHSSGEFIYNPELNTLSVDLKDMDNRVIINTGYDYDKEELFLYLDIDGYDLIQVLNNLKYSPNSRDNKVFAKLYIAGTLFDFSIKNSFFKVDKLLLLSKNPDGIQTTSSLSIIVDNIMKNDSHGNKIYIPNTKVIFEPLIDTVFKPTIEINGLAFSPKSGNTDVISYIIELFDGMYSIDTLRYIEGDSNVIVKNSKLSFSNRLLDIIMNIGNPSRIDTYYGLKASFEQIIYVMDNLTIEVNDTELNYYDDIFKIKTDVRFFGDIGIPLNGGFNISGMVLNGYGQIQATINKLKINKKTVIDDINSLLYVENDLITFSSIDDIVTGELFLDYDKGIYTDVSYSKMNNEIHIIGGIDGFLPWKDLNTINKSNISLTLNSNLSIPKALIDVVDVLEEVSGDLSLNLNLNGNTLKPKITGEIELSNGYLSINGYEEPFSDVYTNIIIQDKKNENNIKIGSIDFISISHYGGEIYGTGEIYYTGLFDLEGILLDITSGPMEDPDVNPLDIYFQQDLIEYDGNLTIQKLRIETDFSYYDLSGVLIPHSTKISLNPLALSTDTTASTATAGAGSFLSGLSFDNLVLRIGSNVQLEVIGELIGDIGDLGKVSFGDMVLIEYNQRISKFDNQVIIKGAVNDFNRMKIRGSLSSKVGQINLLNNPFNIERAEVIFKPNQPSEEDEEEESEDEFNDVEDANTILDLTNENTLAILRLEARTYKRFIDNSPVRISLDYDGPIEELVDNLFSSLRGDYYGTGRIGQLSEGELAVILGISAEDYESYRQDEFNNGLIDPGDVDDGENTQQSFQDLALDSVDNLFFQRLINNIVNSLGFTSGLPFTFSIYSSGFRTIFDRQDLFQDPINAFVIAFSERLEILFGRGFPAVYFLGVPVFENIYVQGGLELINFVEDPDLLPDETPEPREIYLKAKADIDWASGDSWLLNSKLGLAYEPYLNLIDFDLTMQFSYKHMEVWFLNTQLNLSYSRLLSEDTSDITIDPFTNYFDIGLGIQFLFYF